MINAPLLNSYCEDVYNKLLSVVDSDLNLDKYAVMKILQEALVSYSLSSQMDSSLRDEITPEISEKIFSRS